MPLAHAALPSRPLGSPSAPSAAGTAPLQSIPSCGTRGERGQVGWRRGDQEPAGMPELARFFGIIIRMFAQPAGPHHRPHFHAYYQDDVGTSAIDLAELMAGGLPHRQRRLVEAWAEIHQAELLTARERLQAGARRPRLSRSGRRKGAWHIRSTRLKRSRSPGRTASESSSGTGSFGRSIFGQFLKGTLRPPARPRPIQLRGARPRGTHVSVAKWRRLRSGNASRLARTRSGHGRASRAVGSIGRSQQEGQLGPGSRAALDRAREAVVACDRALLYPGDGG